MEGKIKITILVKVPKGDHVRETFADWKKEYIEILKKILPQSSILHGDHIRDDVGSELVVGHDLWTIKNADIVIVDAREKIGAGTAQEILMAKYFKKPLVTVIPKDSHHRKQNLVFNGVTVLDWIHPFLEITSDYIAPDIESAAVWVKGYNQNKLGKHIKGIEVMESAIKRFEHDLPEVLAKYKSQGW
ncbi:MAG: hypothetical protein Q7S76_04315 [bacterium]|nr:hypothetical protein [bacterium]